MNPISTNVDMIVYNVENGVLRRYEFALFLNAWIIVIHEQENPSGRWCLESVEIAERYMEFA